MALATYADLQAALGSWNVDKTNLPTDDLIALAEARMQRDLRLRLQETQTPMTGVVGSRLIPLPDGFLEPLALFLELDGGREALAFVPETIDAIASEGRPALWTVDEADIAFERPCDQAYSFTLTSRQAFSLKSGTSAPANWLYATYPDVYLAAGNVEAALWLQDDAQAERWQLRYADAAAAINETEQRSHALAALRVDPSLQPAAWRCGAFDISQGY